MNKSQQKSHITLINGRKVQYWELNPNSPHLIVMLRGFRSSNQGLMKFAEEFPDYHVILPNYPGYGHSEELASGNTIASYAEFLHDFTDYLKLKDFTIIGHSFGTLVGLIYTSKYPGKVKNLILIAAIPPPNLSTRIASLYFMIGQVLPAPLDYHWLTSRLIQNPVRKYVIQTKDPHIKAEIMAEGEIELRELKPNINVQNFLSVQQIDPRHYLKALSTPTLLIAGTKDRLTKLPHILRAYQNYKITIKVIDGMGHYSPSEIPEQLEKTIRNWITRDPAS